MQDAVIKDGKLFCPVCNSPLGNTKDHFLVTVNGETYHQFIRYCTKQHCMEVSRYEVTITTDDRKVFVFPQDKIKRIKEETKKGE